jgi:hypothetical protein
MFKFNVNIYIVNILFLKNNNRFKLEAQPQYLLGGFCRELEFLLRVQNLY